MVLWTNKYAKFEAKRRNDADAIERKRQNRRESYDRHRDKISAERAERRERGEVDLAAERERLARHRERHPEHYRSRAASRECNRRARKRGAFVEDIDRVVVLARADGVCGICGESVDPLDFHVDHILPLSRGGEHSYANVQPAHPHCNLRKSAKVVLPL